MSISIDTPDGPVLVDLSREEYKAASISWDPRVRPSSSRRLANEDLEENAEETEAIVGDMIGSCIEICQDRIAAVKESDAAMDGDEELENWELEMNTWKLCEFLLPQRLSPGQDFNLAGRSNIYASDARIVADFMAGNAELTEAALVRRWLEETASEFPAVEVRKGYYPHTFKALKDKQRLKLAEGSLVKELDPDAQLRMKGVLDIGDQEYDDHLCRTLYSYIRRGKAEDAIHLCEQSDQPWRAASLMGALLHADDVMDDDEDPLDLADGSGNMNRNIWKACAYRIACEESFSLHERALYAALCGDLRNAMPACQNWEDILWTYYATMLESRSAEALAGVSHVDRLEQDEYLPDGSPFEGPPILALSAEEIFQKIEAIPAEPIRDSVRNPFHRMQKMIILDKLDQLVHDVRNELEEDANSADASRATLFKLPHFLRVLTHLIILYRSAGLGEISQDDANYIIKTYVDMFMLTSAQPPNVLAPYIAELPAHDQVLCFATLLSRLNTNGAQKAELLKLAADYNMDRFSIAAKTVELIVDGDQTALQPPDSESAMDEEERQIDSIGWLTVEKEMYTQAALRSHQIARRFLMRHRLESARKLLRSVPEELIDSRLMKDISESNDVRSEMLGLGDFQQRLEVDLAMEGLFLRQLVTALEDYAEWRRLFSRRPIPGLDSDVRDARGTRRNDYSAQQREKTAWEAKVRELTVQVARELDDLLSIGFFVDKDWSLGLQGLDGFEAIFAERAFLRDIYIPEVVFCLHSVYFDTRDLIPENLEKSIALANKVGDHTRGIYETFVRTKTVGNFLELTRKSCLEALAKKDGSPFPSTEPPIMQIV